MKGVFRTSDTEPFFPTDTDIQPKINVTGHRHSDLVARHFPKFQVTLDTQTPLHGPVMCESGHLESESTPFFLNPNPNPIAPNPNPASHRRPQEAARRV